MAITGTNKLSESQNNQTSPITTGSVAFQDNRLYVLVVNLRGTSQDLTGVSGGGLTWTARAGTAGRELWTGWTTSGASTGTLTLTFSGSAGSGAWWAVDEFTGVDTTTQIVQAPAMANGTATSGSVTLSAFGDAANNAAYGFFTHVANETSTVDASGGYTALANYAAALSPDGSMLTEYKVGQDTSVSGSWTTSSAWHGAALEIKAAATGTTINVDVPGSVTVTGQTVGLTETIAPTSGAATFAGSAIGLRTQIAPAAGAITFAGQTVGLGIVITPTSGAVTFAGSSGITLVTGGGGATTINVDVPGSVTVTGQVVGLKTTTTPVAGALSLAGSAIGLATKLAPTAGALTFTGQTVGLGRGIVPVPGAIAFAGQTIGLRTQVVSTAGALTFTGQVVLVVDSGTGIGLPVEEPLAMLLGPAGEATIAASAAEATIAADEGRARIDAGAGTAALV